LALYALARDLTSPDGGVIAAMFYLFLPFGAIASRSFQPDPLMVMWIVLAWWSFYRWYKSPTWKNAVLAGLAVGIAILVKSVAVFMLLGGMSALLLVGHSLKKSVRDHQTWVVAGLSVLPVIIFMVYGIFGFEMSSQFKGRFFPEMLIDPAHYVKWAAEMKGVIGFGGMLAGLIGVFAFEKRPQRAFVIGLWGGYVVYGLFFPYHFLTHNYYHLPLIPLAALSLAPLAVIIFQKIDGLDLGWFTRLCVVGVLLFGSAIQLWDIRVTLARSSYRHEPAYWAELGRLLDRDAEIMALTHDYGDRIAYYGWINVNNWPDTGDLIYRELRGHEAITFDDFFAERTEGMDYFLVTRLQELERQGDLYAKLHNDYIIVEEGDGYLLFDLNQSKPHD
jgi:4-amino-4-deoxy-L-arabinose transferase-like glycosyltransferase